MEFARDPIVTAATPTATPTTRRLIASSFQSRVRGIGWAALDQLVADAAHRGDVAGAGAAAGRPGGGGPPPPPPRVRGGAPPFPAAPARCAAGSPAPGPRPRAG